MPVWQWVRDREREGESEKAGQTALAQVAPLLCSRSRAPASDESGLNEVGSFDSFVQSSRRRVRARFQGPSVSRFLNRRTAIDSQRQHRKFTETPSISREHTHAQSMLVCVCVCASTCCWLLSGFAANKKAKSYV